jgi:D-serine deaminase-like pyridoxal phosphate-dependent protein
MHGAPGHPEFSFLGDEHGLLEYGADAPALPLGAAIEFLTPHCDPTVNLHDVFWVVRGDTVVDRWVIARGY